MANYGRILTSDTDINETVAPALIGIVLLVVAYFVIAFAISHMPALLESFDGFMKPRLIGLCRVKIAYQISFPDVEFHAINCPYIFIGRRWRTLSIC